jgi:hypothetical protein
MLPDLDGVPDAIGGRVEASEPLTHNQGNAATGGIWRVRGPAGAAVLKIARPPADAPVGSPAWQTSAEPTHWNYWRREVIAYTSGFAARVYAGTGIAPPALLAQRTRPDGGVELWLAEAGGAPGTSWTAHRLGRFAHQLGLAQARWVDRVPAEPWLSRDWLGQYLREGPARRLADPGALGDLDRGCWEHPVAAVWPRRVRAGLRRLWLRRDDVRRAVEAAPRTLCHLDVWPTNLIEDGAGTVLLDWSFVGDGAVGEDPANLIVDSVTDGLMDAAQLPDIDAAVTDGYLAGLRDGGWSGSPDTVRHAIMAAGAAKYSWFGPAVLSRAASGEPYGHSQYGQDHSGEQALLRLRGLMTMLADWAEHTLP